MDERKRRLDAATDELRQLAAQLESSLCEDVREIGLELAEFRRDLSAEDWDEWLESDGGTLDVHGLRPEQALRVALWATSHVKRFDRWKHVGPERLLACTWLDHAGLVRMDARFADPSQRSLIKLPLIEVYATVVEYGIGRADGLVQELELRASLELDVIEETWEDDPERAEEEAGVIHDATRRALGLLAVRAAVDGRMGRVAEA